MELPKEIIEQIGLDDEKIKVINNYYGDEIAKIKGEFEGKANTDAEGILEGAVKYANEKRGLSLQREKGEKWGDFLGKLTDAAFEKQKNDLTQKAKEYEDKLANFKGNDDVKAKLEKLQTDNDALLQKYADYDDIKGKAEQYEPLVNELTTFKKEVAFNKVKPSFPKEANKYEVDAKWNAFKKDILEKYNIEVVDGESVAISKENKHSIKKLADLVSANEEIKSLLVGRQQGGLGSKDVNFVDMEGVPFKVSDEIKTDSVKRSNAIREYLASKGIGSTNEQYTTLFAKYNSIILKGGQKNV